MKKDVIRVIFAIFAGNASADTQTAADRRDGGYNMYDVNGGFVSTNSPQNVPTKSANENSILSCKADVTPSVDVKAVKYNPENAAPLCFIATPVGWYVSTGLS